MAKWNPDVPGTYSMMYTATNSFGGVGTATRTVVVLGAQQVKEQVLAEMLALKATQAREILLLDKRSKV